MRLGLITDRTVILTLDKRLQLAEKLASQLFKRHHINPKLFVAGDGKTYIGEYDHIDTTVLPPRYWCSTIYPTWWERPAAYNAWKCHKKIFEYAVNNNIPRLFLLEDDAFLEDDFQTILNNCADFILDDKWDMLYFGAYHRPGSWSPTKHDNIIKVNGSGGFHGVIIKSKVLEDILTIDPIGPYDWSVAQLLHGVYNCYAIYPSIISQIDNTFSYVENTTLKKPSRYER